MTCQQQLLSTGLRPDWPVNSTTTARPNRSGRASSGSSSAASASRPARRPSTPSPPGSRTTTPPGCTARLEISRPSSGSCATVWKHYRPHNRVSGWRGEGHPPPRSHLGLVQAAGARLRAPARGVRLKRPHPAPALAGAIRQPSGRAAGRSRPRGRGRPLRAGTSDRQRLSRTHPVGHRGRGETARLGSVREAARMGGGSRSNA